MLGPLRLEETVRERQRLLELIAAGGDIAEAEQLAAKLLPPNSLVAQRVRLAVFRVRAAQGNLPADAQPTTAVGAAPAPAAVAAFLAGQQKARHSPGDAVRWAETTEPEPLRAFAALGAALGIAEQRK